MVGRTAEDALTVARVAFRALCAHDWPELRALVDPAALATLKQQAIAVAEVAAAVEVEDPAGVASLGVASLEELRALPAEDVFLRWMAATDSAQRLERATGVVHAIAPVRYTVLGVVLENSHTAHAVYRAEGFFQGVHIESLQWTELGWRLTVEGVVTRALRTHYALRAAHPPRGGGREGA
jgi:hypothetical protein